MKELAVQCTLYFDLLHANESAADAINRIMECLNENDISVQVYESEIREYE